MFIYNSKGRSLLSTHPNIKRNIFVDARLGTPSVGGIAYYIIKQNREKKLNIQIEYSTKNVFKISDALFINFIKK